MIFFVCFALLGSASIRPAKADANAALLEVAAELFDANIYDAVASYWNWMALYADGYVTYRYYAYLYADEALDSMEDALVSAPAGTDVQSAAYTAYYYAYNRYLASEYYYVYGDPAYADLANQYDYWGDTYRAHTGLYTTIAINGDFYGIASKLFEADIYDAAASYYNWIALYSGGHETYRYYAYLHATQTYNATANAFRSAPDYTYMQYEAYYAYLNAYYRYVHAAYYYAYGNPANAELVNYYDYWGDYRRAYAEWYAANLM
ncbi:MAG: hypothetical protein WAK53_16910 [Chromatiaceae bacterium]